jgi:hypothetical protein
MLSASLLSLYGGVKTVGVDAFHAMRVFLEQLTLMIPGDLAVICSIMSNVLPHLMLDRSSLVSD